MLNEGWEEIDIRICVCSICGKEGLCKVLRKDDKEVKICESCFLEDTNRFSPIKEEEE
jgi:hypothetical protein